MAAMMQIVQKIEKVYDVDHLEIYDETTRFIVKTIYADGVKEASLVQGTSDLKKGWPSIDGNISVYVISNKEIDDCDGTVPGRLYVKSSPTRWVTLLAGNEEDHGIVLVDNSRVVWATVKHLTQLKDIPLLFVVE